MVIGCFVLYSTAVVAFAMLYGDHKSDPIGTAKFVVTAIGAPFAAWAFLVSRSSFLSTHPPKIAIQQIEAEVAAGEAIRGRVLLMNCGGSPSPKIRGARLCFYYDKNGLVPRSLPGMNSLSCDLEDIRTFEAGSSRWWSFQWPFTTAEMIDEIYRPDTNARLWIIGMVEHEDRRGAFHRTSFCREFNPATRRFEKKDEYYDYQT